MENYQILWNRTLEVLKEKMSTITYSTYIVKITPIDLIGRKIVLNVPTELFAREISSRLLEKILQALDLAETGVNAIKLTVGDSDVDYLTGSGGDSGSLLESSMEINPKYTFDSFVVGSSNKFLFSAARAVAEDPGNNYNPLFIYGETGLGKTHIMHAIANCVKENNPTANVLYATCEKFTNDLITIIRQGKGSAAASQEFRNRYRNVDVLIIDDVQFLANKEATQEEFFHTFNELYNQDKQIILSADCHPREIGTLSERLKTRFEGGLMAQVLPPDIETKIAILQRKAEERKYILNTEVATFLAENSGSDIRSLEGLLKKVIFASLLHESPITINLAMETLKQAVNNESKEVMTTTNIINTVCSFYNISKNDLLGKKKNKELVEPRQICIFLITELMSIPLVTIGQAMGGRDHTTVIHARDKIAELIKTNPRIATEVNDLKNLILKK
ncbi:MAG: chromosomal replication initiator protein DnaA [Clostridia bacterium]|nr:chromosomal replication initiator protein DnaA [Clostridia bacterium]